MIISNKQYIYIKPETKSDFLIDFSSCLSQLKVILSEIDLSSDSIIKQTIFLNAKNNDDYQHQRNLVMQQLENFYDEIIPPTSCIAQPPDDQQKCTIELILLKEKFKDIKLKRKVIDGVAYSVINYPETMEVYASGITSSSKSYSPLECAHDAFNLMERILKAEKLDFNNITRQWNYIEDILEKKSMNDGIRQNYQIFNDVRSEYYSKAEFKNGFPAATGIGMNTGGIILEFIALSQSDKVNIVPIKNPRQVNAYAYSENVLVGKPINGAPRKTSPKFERAKFTAIENTGQIYVSGTAAILGQESVSDMNAKNQTITTIENIQRLISESNLSKHDISLNSHPLKLAQLRVYAKNEEDLDDVKQACEEYYPGIPTLYLISDICRDDLLVELEGVAEWE